MAEASRTLLGKQDRTAGNSYRGTQSRDIHHWAGEWELRKWRLWTPNDSCGGCALWQSLPGHFFAGKDRTAGNSSRGAQSRDIHHWARGWELQKWPLWPPNDSCGGCALWQSLPGPSFASKLARRVLEGSAARLCCITYFSSRRSRPFWRRLGGCRL